MLLVNLLVMLSFTVMAQDKQDQRQERMEKYRSMRIAYFTENLNLTPDEAEKFWPVFNDYDEKKGEIHQERRKESRDFNKNFDQLTEQEAEKLVDRHIEMMQEEIKLDIEFQTSLKKILPAKKIMKFYITEVKFREYMLHQLRESHDKDDREDKSK